MNGQRGDEICSILELVSQVNVDNYYFDGFFAAEDPGRKGSPSFARVAIPLTGFAAIAGLLLLPLSGCDRAGSATRLPA